MKHICFIYEFYMQMRFLYETYMKHVWNVYDLFLHKPISNLHVKFIYETYMFHIWNILHICFIHISYIFHIWNIYEHVGSFRRGTGAHSSTQGNSPQSWVTQRSLTALITDSLQGYQSVYLSRNVSNLTGNHC